MGLLCDAGSSAYGFDVVFGGLKIAAFMVGGSLIFKTATYRTQLAVGFLIGVMFCFGLEMLTIAVGSGSLPFPAATAVTTFAVFLMLMYLTLTVLMVAFKEVLVQQAGTTATDGGAFPSRGVYKDGEYAAGDDGPAESSYDTGALAAPEPPMLPEDGTVDAGHAAPAVL